MPIRPKSKSLLFAAAAVFAALALLTTISAQTTGGLKGKVRSMRGSGIAGATVTARRKGADIKTVNADSKGNFLLDGLEAGRYNIVFDAPGYSSGVLYNVTCVYARAGDVEQAIACLQRAIQNGFGHWAWLEHDSDLNPLRGDPRFQKLLAGG